MTRTYKYNIAVLCLALAAPAFAQSWPSRPITMVVVFATGGATDIVARHLAAKLGPQLGQQVLVENRLGAGGVVGAASVARAKPDGYTILLLSSSHTVGETLYKDRNYDLVRDFVPTTQIATTPYWLLVNPASARAGTLAELVTRMRAASGKMTYASGGAGGITHLAAEMMRLQGGFELVHIPFKGNAPALTEVIAGRVDMIFDQPASSESFVKSGKLKPLAVTSRARIPTAPDVPTMHESGFPGFEAMAFLGLAFPAGTPREINERMASEVGRALAAPDLKEKLESAGVTPIPSNPAAFGELIKIEIQRWQKVVRDGGISAQ